MVELPIERFMSGHGPVGDHAALVEARDFIHALVDAIRTAIRDGQDERSASVSVVDALSPRFGDWRGFEGLGDSIPEVYRKLKE